MEFLHSPLIAAIWVAWYLYWEIAARNVKATVRREPPLALVAHITPLILAIMLLVAPEPRHRIWLFGNFLTRSPATYWTGVAILVAGLGFAIMARRYLGRNWSGTVTLKEDHELIRTGPYAYVRHPIYSGLLLGFTGSAVALGEWRGLVSIVLVIVAFLLKIRREERFMTEAFGDAYRRYRTQVKALIPFIL